MVTNPLTNLLVRVFYRPPSTDQTYLQELEKSLALVERNGSNLTTVLLGDFNFPGIDWTLPSPSCSDSLSSYFCDISDDYFLYQMVNQATRGDNILDLVFINKPELLSDLTICVG